MQNRFVNTTWSSLSLSVSRRRENKSEMSFVSQSFNQAPYNHGTFRHI